MPAAAAQTNDTDQADQNQQAEQKKEQQQKKNTELRMAATILDQIQQLNEQLDSLREQENQLHEDPQQEQALKAEAKKIKKEIDVLERAHRNRTRSYGDQALNSVCSFLGRSDAVGEMQFHAMRGKNPNDQFRVGEEDEIRILHRDGDNNVLALSLLNLPRGAQSSLKVMRSFREDWDAAGKIDPGIGKLRFNTDNPTVRHYLNIYLQAKHGCELEVNSSRSDRLMYWLRNTSVDLFTRRKVLKAEEGTKLQAISAAYQDMFEDLEKTDELTDAQKEDFRKDLRAALNQAFTDIPELQLTDQQDPKNLLLSGLSTEQVNSYQLELIRIFKERFQDPNVLHVFKQYYDLMQQQRQAATMTASAPANTLSP